MVQITGGKKGFVPIPGLQGPTTRWGHIRKGKPGIRAEFRQRDLQGFEFPDPGHDGVPTLGKWHDREQGTQIDDGAMDLVPIDQYLLIGFVMELHPCGFLSFQAIGDVGFHFHGIGFACSGYVPFSNKLPLFPPRHHAMSYRINLKRFWVKMLPISVHFRVPGGLSLKEAYRKLPAIPWRWHFF